MTAKEEAKELVDIYYKEVKYIEGAKKYALIAVNIMLKNARFIWGGRDTETGLSARDTFRKHWQEVKQEIKKISKTYDTRNTRT
jgi:hypothetical protein